MKQPPSMRGGPPWHRVSVRQLVRAGRVWGAVKIGQAWLISAPVKAGGSSWCRSGRCREGSPVKQREDVEASNVGIQICNGPPVLNTRRQKHQGRCQVECPVSRCMPRQVCPFRRVGAALCHPISRKRALFLLDGNPERGWIQPVDRCLHPPASNPRFMSTPPKISAKAKRRRTESILQRRDIYSLRAFAGSVSQHANKYLSAMHR